MQDLQLRYENGNAPPPASIQNPAPNNKSQPITTPDPSSPQGKRSTPDPIRTLFADRARRLEADRRDQEATAKAAHRKAKALAKKEATSLRPGAAMSKQTRCAAEEKKERLKDEKVAEGEGVGTD